MDRLPEAEFAVLAPTLRLVNVERDESTQVTGRVMHYVDFPVTALLCVSASDRSGGVCEVEMIGREGYVEIDAGLAASVAPRVSHCRIAGTVVRAQLQTFRDEMRRSQCFSLLVQRNISARIFTAGQFVMCSAMHTIPQRAARWLLQCQDRIERSNVPLTHEVIASALGVHRPSISLALNRLQETGAIVAQRGSITIENRERLEAESCECYFAARNAIANALA